MLFRGSQEYTRQPDEVKYYGLGREVSGYTYDYSNFTRADGAFGWLSTNSNGICIAAISNSRTIGTELYNDLNSFFDIINFLVTDKTIPWQQNIDQFN